MPIYFDRTRRRYRYEFDRIIGGHRLRMTKLLPSAWNRDQAERYARAEDPRQYAIATGASEDTARPLISKAVLLYLEQHAHQLKNRDRVIRSLALIQPAFAGRHLDELPDIAREYASREAGRLAPATILNRMAYLRAACRWAWKYHGLGTGDPATRMVMPKVRNARHRYLKRAQVLQLARQIRNREARAVVLVAFYSGMRLGEVMTAQVTADGWLLEDTKNGDRRIVPIHPKVAHLTRHWPLMVAARTVQTRFAAAVKACGFTDLRFHDLRHSAASAMINSGVSLYTVGSVLGHKTPQSTQRYAHLDTKALAVAVASIGARRKG